MAGGEVINLLSSDDERVPGPSKVIQVCNGQIAAKRDEFLYLSDDFDSSVHIDDSWTQSSTKRRKLSPASDANRLPALSSTSLVSADQQAAKATFKKPTDCGWLTIDPTDPIVFSSSPHPRKASPRTVGQALGQVALHGEESDDSLPEDLLAAPPRNGKAFELSERTAKLFASLSEPPSQPKPKIGRKRSGDEPIKKRKTSSQKKGGEDSSEHEQDSGGQTKSAKPLKKSKRTEEEKAAESREKEKEKAAKVREKENAKALSKEQKAKAKEEDQERKRVLKAEQAKEKRIAADLAEVNKSKLDKKDSTPEMIVDLPASIDGQSVDTQAREFLKNLSVDVTTYQSAIPNVIRWRRKVKATWNTKLDRWEPLQHMKIENENHVMVLISAKDFVSLATVQDDNEDVESHVVRLKSSYEDCIPIYLIEGLAIWLRKNKTAENRAYQAKVMSQCQRDDASSGSQQARHKKPEVEIVDEDVIEDALLRLQIMNGCLVHHTAASVETAEWVANFTQHISTIPYRYVVFSSVHFLC